MTRHPRRLRRLAATAAALVGVTTLVGVAPARAGYTGSARTVFYLSGTELSDHPVLWAADPDMSGAHRVLDTGFWIDYPSATADGSLVAMSGWPDSSGRASIYVVRRDGSELQRWTAPSAPYSDLDPVWLPDGRVMFTRYDEKTGASSVLVKRGSAGTATALAIGGATDTPSPSPDGRYVTYVRNRALMVANANGTDAWVLRGAWPGYAIAMPSWSPDGRHVAFVESDGTQRQIIVMDVATRQHDVVADYGSGWVSRPAWRDDAWQLDWSVTRSTAYGETANLVSASVDGVVPVHGLTAAQSGGRLDFEPTVGGGVGPVPGIEAAPAAHSTVTASGSSTTVTVPSAGDAARRIVRVAEGDVAPATPGDGAMGYDGLRPAVSFVTKPATVYSVSAWLVDWSGHLGAPSTRTFTTPDTTSLSLAISKPVVTYGQWESFTGRLVDSVTGAGLAGRTVTVQRPGSYQRYSATTDSDGYFRRDLKGRGYTDRWTATFAAAPGHDAAQASVTVLGRFTIHLQSLASVPRGTIVEVYVTSLPDRPDALQVYSNGGWHAVLRYCEGPSSANTYDFEWYGVPKGVHKLRVIHYADAEALRSLSNVVTFTVT